MSRPQRCYLAGPMRSRPEFNYPAFHQAAAQLREAGWYVYNPAEMDIARDNGGPDLTLSLKEQGYHAADFRTARRYATRDLKVITQQLQGECGDAIVYLEGWAESIGAQAEIAASKWVNLRVLSLEEALA